MAVIKKIKIPGETLPRDIGVNSSNVIYDGDSGTTTTLNSKIQSIFTAIGDINSFEIALVNALPTENIDDHTIYFVPNSQDANTRDEYMYVGNQWEMIGSTTIDLSDYPTYDDITITQGLTTGIPAATITVGATTTTIYSADGSNHMVKGVDYVTAGKKSGTTIGTKSTAEGSNTTANGSFAHAEGTNTTSSGAATHAEGDSTTAQNTGSHAEGGGTKASGNYSHAEGFFTTANTKSQHVFGEYNILDSGSSSQRGSYVEIVGNGTSSTPSNARTLNWNGNEWLAGKVTVGNITPTAAGDLTSKDYVDTKISTATSTIPTVTPVASLTTGITIGSINVGGTTTIFYAPETNADTLTPTLDTRYLLKQPSALNTFTQATTSNTITVSALDLSRTASIAQETDKIKLSVNQDTLSTAPLSYIQLSAKNDNEYSPGSILTINHTGITINKEPAGTWDVVNKGYVDSKINTVTSTIPTVTPVAALTTGITIGSIDVSGTTTVFYAPESKDYIVTFTSEYDSENDEYIVSCDKSINEIVTKYNNGYNISAKYYTLIGQLAYVEQNDDQYNLSFLFYDVDDSSAAYKYIYMYTEDGDDIMSEENLYFPSAPESEFIKLYDQSSLETLYNNRYKYVKWECTADQMNYMLIHDEVVSGPNGNTTFVFLGVNKVVSVNDEILTTLYTRTINYNTNTYESIKNNTILSLSTKTKPYANQVQADWNMSVQDATAYIRNKPTKLSQFTNDTNFINFNSATETFDLRYIKIRGNDYKNGDLTFADIDSPKQITISNDAITFSLGDSGAFTTSLSYSDIRRTTPRLTFGRTTILNMVSTPEEPAEAANKQYVDDQISSVTATIPSITATAGLTTGVTIGAIDINGVTTTLYAPSITEPVQSDWTQATTTSLDYIKNKPAVWDSEDYTLPEGATSGNSTTKAINAVAANYKDNNAKGDYSWAEGYAQTGNRNIVINGVTTQFSVGALGKASHVEGSNNIAFGDYSHAEGSNNTAYGSHSHVEGNNNIASGSYSHAEGQSSVASKNSSHAEGKQSTASGSYSHAEGNQSTASGQYSHAEGNNNIASGSSAHAEGYYSVASGLYSHVEGGNSVASGNYSHAEGNQSTASGQYSHAEGHRSASSGNYSHAEGQYSVAGADFSHVEGEGLSINVTLSAIEAGATTYTLQTPYEISSSSLLPSNKVYVVSKSQNGTSWSGINPVKITSTTFSGNSLTGFTVEESLWPSSAISDGAKAQIVLSRTISSATASHVQGKGTVSRYANQHVSGKWNNYAQDRVEVIGNGTDDLHRSNIRTLDWDGNEWLAGKLTVGTTPTANMDVTTKQYVDSAVAGASGKAYTLSMTGPTINLLADGVAASTITLPIYDGTII